MMRLRTLFFLLAIACSFVKNVYGMTTYSYCHIYKVESSNHGYFLWSYPYDNIMETTDGRTVVYKADSTFLYEIPRYFEVLDGQKLFISNDGKAAIYVQDKEYEWNGAWYKCVELYRDGKKFKEYSMPDISSCNNEDEYCRLLYNDAIENIKWEKDGKRVLIFKEAATDFEKKISEEPVCYSNDTTYIFTNKNMVVKIDVLTGNIAKEAFTSLAMGDLSSFSVMNIQSHRYDIPFGSDLKLVNGKSYEKALAEYLDMIIFPDDSKATDKYKRHIANVGMYIDYTGQARLLWVKDYNSVPRDKIESFLSEVKFETSKMPKNVDKWYATSHGSFMSKDKREAKRERRQEIVEEKIAYEKRLVADSIDGIYIPKNIEECFIELNKILKSKDIERIKKDGGGLYHFGLGTWIRNSWGLWGGSRLMQYLRGRGVFHPDDMSGTILELYHSWLNGRHTEWKKFDTE